MKLNELNTELKKLKIKWNNPKENIKNELIK